MKEKHIIEILNEYLDKHNIFYANEIKMGIGIPDVIIATNIPLEYITINDYNILEIYNKIISKNIKNINEIYNIYSINRSRLNKYIGALLEQGIIELHDKKIEIKKRIPLKHNGVVISLEIKVKDWRNGLLQAERYLSFSDFSYLGIYEQYLLDVDINHVYEKGIGLLSISENNIKEIIKPGKSKICNDKLKYISISNLLDSKENNCMKPQSIKNIWNLEIA